MVVFGNEVTKILCNSLFTFLLSKARQAKTEHMEMKISQPIFDILAALTKNELTNICNKPGISLCEINGEIPYRIMMFQV